MAKVCYDCREVLPNDIERGVPCQNCGGTRRTIAASTENTLAISDSTNARVVRHWWKLMEVAENLYTGEYFEPAVIVAQTACEVVSERAISKGFSTRGVPELDGPITKMLSSFSPRSRNTRRLYKELTGNELGSQPFWQAYDEMVVRRNNAVHSGQKISEADARIGLDAARKLVEHVEQHNGLQA